MFAIADLPKVTSICLTTPFCLRFVIWKQGMDTELEQVCDWCNHELEWLWESTDGVQPLGDFTFDGWRVKITDDCSDFLITSFHCYRSRGRFTLSLLAAAWSLFFLGMKTYKQISELSFHDLAKLRFVRNLAGLHCFKNLQAATKLPWFDVVCPPTENKVL